MFTLTKPFLTPTLRISVGVLEKTITHPTFNVNCFYDNKFGCLLSFLIASHNFDLADQLLQRPGVDVDLQIQDHTPSPLQAAAACITTNYSEEATTLLAKMLPLSKNPNADFLLKNLITAASKGNNVLITALMKIPQTDPDRKFPTLTALQEAQRNGHRRSVALLKRTMIRDYDALIKKLLENKFVCSAGFGWNGLLNHVVLCTGFYTPKIEAAAIKLANLMYVLEWPNILNPYPEKLLGEIIADDPLLINKFIEAIVNGKYKHPFSKQATVKKLEAVIAKVMSQNITFPVESPEVRQLVVAKRSAETVSTLVRVSASTSDISSSTTATSSTTEIVTLTSEAQQKTTLLRNQEIQAQLEKNEEEFSSAEQAAIKEKVQADVSNHLLAAKLSKVDIDALLSLCDIPKVSSINEFNEIAKRQSRAVEIGNETGSQLAKWVSFPNSLFEKNTVLTLAKKDAVWIYLRSIIHDELIKLIPGPAPVSGVSQVLGRTFFEGQRLVEGAREMINWVKPVVTEKPVEEELVLVVPSQRGGGDDDGSDNENRVGR